MESEAISAQARQFVRHETRYEARIEPHPDHADQFRLSLPDNQCGLAVIDVSAGGLGLKSGIYIPKNMRLILHISGLSGPSGDDSRDLVIQVIVRRCSMLDHRPTYRIGLQFLDPGGHDEQVLVESATQSQAQRPVSEGPTSRGHVSGDESPPRSRPGAPESGSAGPADVLSGTGSTTGGARDP